MEKEKEFIALIKDHQKLINKILFLYADNIEDRMDLRQEILLEAWKSFSKFKGISKFSTWLYRIGLNVSFRKLNRDKKFEYTHEYNMSTIESRQMSHQELLDAVLRALNPVEKSIVLLLIEGYKQEEIVAIIGITPVNLRVKTHRIRTKLKNYGIEALVE